MPSSPTEVFSRKRPLICSSESRVAAKTFPETWARSSKLTVAESPGGMVSMEREGSPVSVAPLM